MSETTRILMKYDEYGDARTDFLYAVEKVYGFSEKEVQDIKQKIDEIIFTENPEKAKRISLIKKG